MMILLLDNGAGLNAKDDHERTAWSTNVRMRNHRVLGIFLQMEGDLISRGLQRVSEL